MSPKSRFTLRFAPEVVAHLDDLESLILARSPRFQALLGRSRKSLKSGKGLSSEQFWRTVNERKAEYKTK